MDPLVLNLADDDSQAVVKAGKKGGRWTDRVKARRSLKRKRVLVEQQVSSEPQQRPKKRQKTDEKPTQALRRPTQIISSLFTSNPAVEHPVNKKTKSTPVIPSNAPLNDAASFADLGLDPLLASHLAKMNISKPTSIQRAVLSFTLSSTSIERDIFIQSQTGSGKTLAFLLPIIQDLLPLSSLSYIDRSVGTLAVIIAPTRELAKQISDVLESLLKLRLRAENELADDGDHSRRLTRWLVSGLLIGGATRTHEKARLRKGVPILVSTPGRLLDHLQNTASFNVGKCRWLVLDEADRLMELGFEETIKGITRSLDGYRNLAIQASEQGFGQDVGGWDYTESRRTILCSATIQDDVQKLAGNTLSNPVVIKATKVESEVPTPTSKFTPPSQLSQKYVVVPLKLRLVVLAALLRFLIGQSGRHSDMKIVVFLSCTDSVDFHWHLLSGTMLESNGLSGVNDEPNSRNIEQIGVKCSLLPDTLVFRLHGTLSTQTRLETVAQFSECPSASVLFCTSVASRGLDLPLVSAVVQYDLPTEGGATEYVHRVGRTARAGRDGQAWAFVTPNEVEWVKWIEKSIVDDRSKPGLSLMGIAMETVLRNGFGGKGDEYQERATEVQLSFERWVLQQKDHADVARSAFLSYIRAYATHPSAEKHIFHVKNLHFGHLAKAFALREAPKTLVASRSSKRKGETHYESARVKDTEKRMQDVVRAQGRLTKQRGMMMSTAVEFQIAGGDDLEKLVNQNRKVSVS